MNATSGEETVPALYEHCVRAYKAMLAESKVVMGKYDVQATDVVDGNLEVGRVVVYEGFMTKLIVEKLSLSVPYYTHVTQALTNMGCIKQLRRGGGTSPSQWEMITEPTVEAFMKQRPPKKAKVDKYSMMQDQISQLGTRITDLEDMVQEMLAAWAREFGTKEVKE